MSAVEVSRPDFDRATIKTVAVKKNPREAILSGWKEIADYLGREVRTVQRYEIEKHLPIRHPAGESVIATKSEIDRWASIALTETAWDRERANRARANFLLIDSEMALTFSGIALQDSNQDNRLRRTQIARKAFDAITRLREGVALTDKDANKVNDN